MTDLFAQSNYIYEILRHCSFNTAKQFCIVNRQICQICRTNFQTRNLFKRGTLQYKLDNLLLRLKCIELIKNGKINHYGSEQEVLLQLEKHNIPEWIFYQLILSDLTDSSIKNLQKKSDKLNKRISKVAT